MRIDLYHGILWSKYKAEVFSEMHRLASIYGVDIKFYQIAETDTNRATLSTVDMRRHSYPFELLFRGAYSNISKIKLISAVFRRVYFSDAQVILLPGFSELAHWAMLIGALLSGKKRAVFCDSTLNDRSQSKLKSVLKKLYFRSCNGYFTYGRRGREYLVHYGANPRMVFQRVQAAALPECYSLQSAKQARFNVSHASDAPVFLYVGRLSSEKSIDILLRAFAKILSELPNALLRIVGSGPKRDELMRLSDQLGLLANVNFVGSLDLDALAHEYTNATCFVLPSRSEPWGLVVNEALHFGCPVVVSDACGCVPELVVEGITGFSFRVGDAEDLSRCMFRAVSAFADTEKTLDNCLRVIADYSPEKSARQTLEGCQKVLTV